MVRLGISLAAAAHAERVRLGALGWAGETAAFLNILQPTQMCWLHTLNRALVSLGTSFVAAIRRRPPYPAVTVC